MHIVSLFANNPNLAVLIIIIASNLLFMLFGTAIVHMLAASIAWAISKTSFFLKSAIIVYISVVIAHAYVKTNDITSTLEDFHTAIVDQDTVRAYYSNPKNVACKPADESSSFETTQKCLVEALSFCDKLVENYVYISEYQNNYASVRPYANIIVKNDRSGRCGGGIPTSSCSEEGTRYEDDGEDVNDYLDQKFIVRKLFGEGLSKLYNFFYTISQTLTGIVFEIFKQIFNTILSDVESKIMLDVFHIFNIPKQHVVRWSPPDASKSHQKNNNGDATPVLSCNVDFTQPSPSEAERTPKWNDCNVVCANLLFEFVNASYHVGQSPKQHVVSAYRKLSTNKFNYYHFYANPTVRYERAAAEDNDTAIIDATHKNTYFSSDYAYSSIFESYEDVLSAKNMFFTAIANIIVSPNTVIRLSNVYVMSYFMLES